MIQHIEKHALRLNLTSSLAKSHQLLQTGLFNIYPWDDIINIFQGYFFNNISNEKDTYGYSFGDFSIYDFSSWRMKIYAYYLRIEADLSKSLNEKATSRNKFKWDKVNTEDKRIQLINSLTNGQYENSFHRISKDIINKQAIIIDYDNSTFLASGSKKIEHNIQLIEPHEINNILQSLGCSYIGYSSFNNKIKNHHQDKFRIIIPTNRPYTLKENKLIKEYILNRFTVRNYYDYIYGLVDITSFEMSRFFYIPVNKQENNNKWFSFVNNNQYLDVDSIIKKRNYEYNFNNNYKTWKQLIDTKKEIINDHAK